jgi:hypothetical protein
MTDYFHGSSDKIEIDDPLREKTNVSRDKCNALMFALRRRVGNADCYIYKFLLSPDEVKQIVDAAGVVDHVLTRETPYVERILVTDMLIDECRARTRAMGLT